MGAISSDIVHLLKVNCPYKMTRDGFSCFIGLQIFLGEDPRTPPSLPDKKISDLFFNPTLLNTSL